MASAAKTAARARATVGTSTSTSNVPLRLIALPLCKKPELIYFYAQKRKDAQGKATTEAHDNSTENAAPPAAAPSAESSDMATRATNLITKATSECCARLADCGRE